ncbi:MAG TPA: hypothetical protein VN328_13295 [Thermodesulfovibrionales bacterium]|nr:hypothetical protein [Thermodesulfovibrionales bacterium]
MNNSTNSRKNAARVERQQRKLDAGFMAAQFPEVASIVINMTYNQRGVQKALPRVVNFFPSSYALFRVDCLSRDCVDGGFDLTQVITGMIKNRREASKGDLSCEGDGPSAEHSTIVYEVAIQYT